jgi:hypothetical protein
MARGKRKERPSASLVGETVAAFQDSDFADDPAKLVCYHELVERFRALRDLDVEKVELAFDCSYGQENYLEALVDDGKKEPSPELLSAAADLYWQVLTAELPGFSEEEGGMGDALIDVEQGTVTVSFRRRRSREEPAPFTVGCDDEEEDEDLGPAPDYAQDPQGWLSHLAKRKATEERIALRGALDALRAAGVAQVTVTYDGAGDSGSLQDIAIDGAFIDGQHPLCGLIEEACYAVLEANAAGWEINEGSHGTIVLHVAEGTLSADHYWRGDELDEDPQVFTVQPVLPYVRPSWSKPQGARTRPSALAEE